MNRSMIRRIALAAALLAGVPAALADDAATDQAIDAALGDHAPYRTLFDSLKTAVAAGDAAAVAKLVDYPITVTIGGRKTKIADPRAFVANYAAIVTPAIAAAVNAQSYGDLFVNSQGIMIGDGEVWINGICRDKSCAAFDARVITIQAGPDDKPAPQQAAALAAAASSAPAVAGALKGYKDWVIGCDNGRACVAIGMTSDEDSLSGYVRIARDGAADAVPQVAFVAFLPDGADKPKTPMAKLSLDAHKAGGLPAEALPLEEDGDVYRLALAADAVPDFLLALRSATKITLDVYDGDRKLGGQVISLAGSSAVLLQMDDQQKRIGTVTALVKQGAAAAGTIPPVPALPVVRSLPVADMADPLPKAPRTAAKPSTDCSEGVDPYVAYALPGGASLWGACASTGAYNFAYDFRLFVGGKAGKPWSFAVPGLNGGGDGDDASWLWNTYVDEDGKTLNSYFKGRGLGDCGDATTWAFDGEGFAALEYRTMDPCRGVLQDDWPVLYRAQKG